ncbi:MAG: D-2-hydroxyacid dehydrogenase, partial [Spirochaetales bacterium]|nr:D-2-hydroxyacid dehydrogenase [Spirochaetales bacterium]
QAVATIARAFGMRVIAYDLYQSEEHKDTYVDLDDLFAQSDVISLHCPLFEATKGIINKKNITKMKDGVIILNTSRGPLIVEEDLVEGLESGKVGYAALDVVSVEPIDKDNPLLKAKNVLITPHIAWAPKESRARLMDIAVANLSGFLSGSVQNQVNS